MSDEVEQAAAVTVGLLPDCDHPTSRGVCPDCIAQALAAANLLAEPAADTRLRAAIEGRGWFADWDNDATTEYGWQPCMETGHGHIPCFEVWFRTKAECEEWIADNVIGIGWLADHAPQAEEA